MVSFRVASRLALGCLVLVLTWSGAAAAPGWAAEQVPARAWRWPLDRPAAVVHRFDAPAGPFAAGHRGVDIAASVGDRVLAAGAGVVAFAGRVAGRGVVSVDHPGGLRTTYEPVVPAVSRGEPVAAGDLLGHLEAFGSHCPSAACLHWGLRRGAAYLDPLTLLGPVRVRLLPVWSAAEPPTPLVADASGSARPPPVLHAAPVSAGGGRAGSGAGVVALAALAAAGVGRVVRRHQASGAAAAVRAP